MKETFERRAFVTLQSNTRCKVSFRYPGLDDAEVKEKETKRIVNLLDDALAIDQKGSHFNPAVQRGLWDGRRHLFVKEGRTFPKGITKRLKKLLREAGYKVMKTRDERANVPEPIVVDVKPDMLATIILRDDQLRVITAALTEGCGLLHVATGGGKTSAAAAIVKTLINKRALFLVHTKQLLHQARHELARFLGTIEEYIGVIGDGRFEPKQVTIATEQSLTRVNSPGQKKIVAKYLKTIDVLIKDEVHHASAKSSYKLIQRIDAPWRFGLSGTPFGLADGKGLMVEAAFGPVVARVTNEELIEKGINARPTITMHEVTEPKIEAGLDWHSVYKLGIVGNDYRNGIIADEAKKFAAKKWPTLVMVRELWHGDNICSLLRDRKVSHAFVHGQMPNEEVERQKHRLVEGAIHVLVASPIFGEGVDVPSVRALVMADGGQSTAHVLQRIGRGLRRKADDNRLDVVDFADLQDKWLARHSNERIALYEGEGFTVEIAPASRRKLRDAT